MGIECESQACGRLGFSLKKSGVRTLLLLFSFLPSPHPPTVFTLSFPSIPMAFNGAVRLLRSVVQTLGLE